MGHLSAGCCCCCCCGQDGIKRDAATDCMGGCAVLDGVDLPCVCQQSRHDLGRSLHPCSALRHLVPVCIHRCPLLPHGAPLKRKHPPQGPIPHTSPRPCCCRKGDAAFPHLCRDDYVQQHVPDVCGSVVLQRCPLAHDLLQRCFDIHDSGTPPRPWVRCVWSSSGFTL